MLEQNEYEPVIKPDDWPANAIEHQLENIATHLENFRKDPTYKTKEVIISLVSSYDLNQKSSIGLFRTTKYEVAIINSIFLSANFLNFSSLKTYLYELIGLKTRMQKIASWFPEGNVSLEIEEFSGLINQLKLYYVSYQKFTVEKEGSFIENLIDIVELSLKKTKEEESEDEYNSYVSYITRSFITMINDISHFKCKKVSSIWAFTREEILDLFKFTSKLIEINGDNPIERPLKGVLMISLSNYLLKSRNGYNDDYICKYISQEVAKKSIENHEIWMSIIENLNDEREQKVLPELFCQDKPFKQNWVKDIDFTPHRKYYVSSFCKSVTEEKMKNEYGECIYGYKDDRVSDLLAPLFCMYNHEGECIHMFSQVLAFDVIYDKEEARKEIDFLCEVIDLFNMSEKNKKSFLEDILQYWILSIKDKKWEHERERRYVIFMYDDYDYKEIDIRDPTFLKLKTSLFTQPDFILGNNPVKQYIKMSVDNKRKAISLRPYQFCEDCLNRDFDIVVNGSNDTSKCAICDSKKVSISNQEK